MTGRVVIVTGANSGIGFEVARYMCEGGNDVVLACRSEERAKRAVDKITKSNTSALATPMTLDLSSVESIRKFVDDFHATEKKLHVLVNNAGVQSGPKEARQYTKENFELAMGTNHLGHFLLTDLLLGDLKKMGAEEGGEARIINVSDAIHDPDTLKRKSKAEKELKALDVEDMLLLKDGTYSGLQAYKNSKAAQLMCMYELERRLKDTGVVVNTVAPGMVPSTDLSRSASKLSRAMNRYVIHPTRKVTKLTQTVEVAAKFVWTLATDDKFKEVTGKYFREGEEVKSSEETLNEETQKKVWELSGGYLKLDGYEPIEVPEPPPAPEPVEVPKKKKTVKKEAKAASGVSETVAEGETAANGDVKDDGGDKKETTTTEEKDEETRTEEVKTQVEEEPKKEEVVEESKKVVEVEAVKAEDKDEKEVNEADKPEDAKQDEKIEDSQPPADAEPKKMDDVVAESPAAVEAQ